MNQPPLPEEQPTIQELVYALQRVQAITDGSNEDLMGLSQTSRNARDAEAGPFMLVVARYVAQQNILGREALVRIQNSAREQLMAAVSDLHVDYQDFLRTTQRKIVDSSTPFPAKYTVIGMRATHFHSIMLREELEKLL